MVDDDDDDDGMLELSMIIYYTHLIFIALQHNVDDNDVD